MFGRVEPGKAASWPSRRRLLALLLAVAAGTGQVTAQVPVTESAPASRSGDAARLGELFHRLQVLQREVQELRGLVEEQAYQIERLSKQQKQQYIDLDQRLVAMRGAAPAAGAESPAAPGRPLPARPGSSAAGAVPLERDAYTGAFNLMQEKRFDESVQAFNQLITDFPNGNFTPNAFYWLGELYLVKDEVEQARQSFAQVLALYPQHAKVSDALYKLGVIHHRLEDNERALQYLNRVIAEHPDSPAAGLARTYAGELQ